MPILIPAKDIFGADYPTITALARAYGKKAAWAYARLDAGYFPFTSRLCPPRAIINKKNAMIPVCVNNKFYPSKTEARRALGLSLWNLNKLLRERGM